MESKKELLEILFKRYNSMILSRKEVATILGISTATLDRLRAKGKGPRYKKQDGSKNATVSYSLEAVVDYLTKNEIKTED